ncbi:MAG: hypothetical protein ABIR37_03350 [Candidatus Saccharimonadales bacterium]
MEPQKPTEADTVPPQSNPEPVDQQPVTQPTPETVAPAPDADIDESDVPTDMELEDEVAQTTEPRQNIVKRALQAIKTNKKLSIPLAVLGVIIVLLAVPVTRYPLLGTFLKQDYKVAVLDESTKKPVTNATLTLAGRTVKTDNTGQATLHTKVGKSTLTAEKKYYQKTSSQVLVPILKPKDQFRIFIKATGRQVPVTVINRINNKPVENALVRAADTEARTNAKGETVLVLPADKPTIEAHISASGYNDATTTVVVTEQKTDKNAFQLTPAGKLYFLSKLSGKVDVVKTDLDGTNRQIVLAGTGNEVGNDTILLASRDWKYLAFKSKRDNGLAKLYLIDTSNDKLTTIDEGNASFTPVGWYGSHFVYTLSRSGVQNWQPNAQALKTFDASTAKLSVIDQTAGEGTGPYDYAYTNFSSIYILENEVVYTENWYASYGLPGKLDGKSVSLVSVHPDGSSKKTIKDYAIPAGTQYNYYVGLQPYEPQALYVQLPAASGNTYFAYEDGKLVAKSDMNDQKYYSEPYPTYLLSPSGKQTFWSEQRDGKNTLFVGDANASTPQQIAALSEYLPYGWYSDDYLLVSKNSSELYVMAVSGGKVAKVTDYHKPAANFQGYGYGYGGL